MKHYAMFSQCVVTVVETEASDRDWVGLPRIVGYCLRSREGDAENDSTAMEGEEGYIHELVFILSADTIPRQK
jgi:hypothetical protein